ncbi:MAG: putative Ig domain-containing protein, partial [Luteolibacter sp.]
MKLHRPLRRLAIATLAAAAFLAQPVRASIAYGSINNFDTVNDTGHECHGFEIEIEDCHSTDISYTYDYNHYGTSHITQDDSIPGHPKCLIRWESKKNPDGSWASYTAIPSGPVDPTNGHMFTNPSVNFGGEHFGVGYYVAVGAVRYNWLIDDGAGNLISGGAVQVSTPTFTYYPPVAGGVGQVQAEIQPPEVEVPEVEEFGKAIWMKEIRTTSHSNEKVRLRDLVSDDPARGDEKNWKNGEADEVETEWQLLQKENGAFDGGGNGKKAAAAEDLPDGDEVVTRRYEFYKYVGPLDNFSGEAMGDKVGPDNLHGTGTGIVNGVETDLSTVEVVGDYTGAQMAAVDVEAAVDLIDHVSEGRVNSDYTARKLVIEGAFPFESMIEGALPAGMQYDEFTGILSGNPSESGEFNFRITATDTINPDVSKNYTLLIAEEGAELPPTSLADTTSSPVGTGTTTGDGAYAPGSPVMVEASAEPGYRFVNYTFNIDVNHSLVAHFTLDLPRWTIATNSSPLAGGSTAGGGFLDEGSQATVVATPAAGYSFSNWTENGVQVSTTASYTFTISTNRALVANFIALPSYVVGTSSSPSLGGTTSGGGNYFSGASATLTATPAQGYVFKNWTSGSNQVSESSTYTFVVTSAKNLVANFVLAGISKTITVTSSSTTRGTVSGGANYLTGDSVTMIASPKPGYAFS